MATLQELKAIADELGLSSIYVGQFGYLTRKRTWERAIASAGHQIAKAKNRQSQIDPEVFALAPLSAPDVNTDITSFVPPVPSAASSIPLPKPEKKPTKEPKEEKELDPQTLILDSLPFVELNTQELENEIFQENYKNWSIYFSIPNGGILGGTIANPRKSQAWSFSSQFLSANLYYAKEWHLQVARRFVNLLIQTAPRSDSSLLKLIPPEFSEEQKQVAIALMENFQVVSKKNEHFFKVTALLPNFQPIQNVNIHQIKVVKLARSIFAQAQIYFFCSHRTWVLKICQNWKKPYLPSVNVCSVKSSFVEDITILINKTIVKTPHQKPPNDFYLEDYCLPDNLIGAPRLIAKHLSANFNWQSKEDNSHFGLCSPGDYLNSEIIEGVKILHTTGHYHHAAKHYSEVAKVKKYSAIVLFTISEASRINPFYFSRSFTWEVSSSFDPNANLKEIARQYLRDTIQTFIGNVKLSQKAIRSDRN